MHRLQSEWQRLYATDAHGGTTPAPGMVRALVLQLARPADWRTLSCVWQGVQTQWGLPAPGIAVNGTDGYQLWFSLKQAVPVTQANAFLRGLQTRYLPDVAVERMSLWPQPYTLAAGTMQQAPRIPNLEAHPVAPNQWSAFLAPDLAPVFQGTPWLDLPPNLEGQADLLSQLDSISPADWERVCAPLDVHLEPTVTQENDPRQFLLNVMNNDHIDMALRIEAAKALLSNPSRT